MNDLSPVRATLPVAPYIGGKRNLSGRLVKLINEMPHNLYAEGFVGMAGVFLRRTMRPRIEAINDISADVTTLFRILQRHYQQFLDVLKWQLASRAEFERLIAVDPTTLTDLERAARFLYLQRTAFGGKVAGRNFGVSRTGAARFDLTKLVPMLEDVHERLCGVQIERLDFGDFIDRYDTPGTMFYLDPPYHGCEQDYGPEVFTPHDFARLRTTLDRIKGRFIVSINDTPQIREVFAGLPFEEVGVSYGLSIKPTQAHELIITGSDGIR